MKAFITGGAGFIGSHLVDTLISHNHHVTVFDNLSSGYTQFIDHHKNNPKFTFIHADLLDLKAITKALLGHDTVFHIAANPDVRRGADEPDIAKNDIIATYNLLNAMRQHHIKKIVFSSSSTIYGETPKKPLPENYGPLLPISVYGAAKLAAEGLITAFTHTYNMQSWIFRFANVVGSRGTHGVIVDFIHKLQTNPHTLEILGDGKQQKPYLNVTDCVNGILHGYTHAHEEINVFNLGTESATDVTNIAKFVTHAMNLKNVQFSYTGGKRGWKGDIPHFQFDITKIKNLGWKPTLSSDEAVQYAIQDILGNNL